ncbi:hypothetical protein ACFL22_00220 [Patescibacteria group bacterium]
MSNKPSVTVSEPAITQLADLQIVDMLIVCMSILVFLWIAWKVWSSSNGKLVFGWWAILSIFAIVTLAMIYENIPLSWKAWLDETWLSSTWLTKTWIILAAIVLSVLLVQKIMDKKSGTQKSTIGEFLSGFFTLTRKLLLTAILLAILAVVVVGGALWINPDGTRAFADEIGIAYLLPKKVADTGGEKSTSKIKVTQRKQYAENVSTKIVVTPGGVTFNTGIKHASRIDFSIQGGCVDIHTPKGGKITDCQGKHVKLPKDTYTNGLYFIEPVIKNDTVIVTANLYR